MKPMKCDKVENHFFDGEKYSCCPHCYGEAAARIRQNAAPENKDTAAVCYDAAPLSSNDMTIAMYDEQPSDMTIAMYDEEPSDVTIAMYDDEVMGEDDDAEADDSYSIVTIEMYDDGTTSVSAEPEKITAKPEVIMPASAELPDSYELMPYVVAGNGECRCINCFMERDAGSEPCPHCGHTVGVSPREPYHLFTGMTLNERYIIGEVLGFGGFGITYKAWDKKLDTIVAVKEYYPSGIVNRIPRTKDVIIYAQKRTREYEFGKTRFLNEARNMAKFNSEPNIVNVYEFFEENHTAYIVMEYLDGFSLSQHLSSSGGILDIEFGLKVTEAIANALKKIHSKGIIHRDVSPDNIFLCSNGAIKLIDFGAARFSQDENKLMTIILKPGFAPPEQYEKINAQGPWTDVYALGATLYYIITGVKPEESTNRKIKDALPYPHEVNAEIPEYLSNTIMKAMAIDVHMRFRNVSEFLEGLNREKKILPVAVEKKKKKKRRIIGITAAAAVLAAGISITAFNWEKEKDAETLPDSTIRIWYCKNGDQELDEAEEASYKAIIDDFNSSFPNVTVIVEGFEAEEYAQKLQSGEQPNLYEYIDRESSAKHLSLKDIYGSEAVKQCQVLKDAEKYYGSSDYLPLGFNAPIVFEDILLSDYQGSGVKSADDFTVTSSEAKNLVIDYNGFGKMMNGIDSYYSQTADSEFYKETAAFYGTLTNRYIDVADELPAQYRILYCDVDKVYCTYDNVWAANDIDKDQNKASLRFLEFMLNNNAQDVMHIQNKSRTLPVNDEVIKLFESVNGEFMGFFVNKDKYVFEK